MHFYLFIVSPAGLTEVTNPICIGFMFTPVIHTSAHSHPLTADASNF